jgi:[protein-PII] uridylyltransferase
MDTVRMKPVVEAARQRLAEGQSKIQKQHHRGSPGIQIGAKISDLCDEVVLDVFKATLADMADSDLAKDVCLVAHSGYGRRDMAPFSDVDLMLLHARGEDDRVAPLARQLSQDLVDSGMDLGFSLRRSKEAVQLGMKDPSVLTALSESRWLAGNEVRFDRFMVRLKRETKRRAGSLLQGIDQARREERLKFGDTVHLLRPNVKRSRGGLRDIQLIRWVGFVLYGTTNLTQLEQLGALIPDERRTLRDASEFLLQLRNELHFHCGKSQDNLEKTEQVRLASLYGFVESKGLLPVEQFMRQYFEHTSNVRYISSNFLTSAKGRSSVVAFFGNLFSRADGREYRIGPRHIRATKFGLAKLKGDFPEILRLMMLANSLNRWIDHDTWQSIRIDMMTRQHVPLLPLAIDRFLSLMAEPARLAELLRRLHQLRVLEHLVPPMEHARSLLQFNEYHKYTIDEHCILAVQNVTDLIDDDTVVGELYRNLRKKKILHLALLLHDLGKGFPDDHSIVGARLAEETCRHLRMSPREIELIRFLVEKHLRLSHMAFRHDLTDDRVILGFATEVGSVERLRLLLLLTIADIAAVGPGVLNKWKKDLLIELYERTRAQLSGDIPLNVLREENARKAIFKRIEGNDNEEWLRGQIRHLPQGLLAEGKEDDALEILDRLHGLPHDQAVAWGRFDHERNAVEYTVGAYEHISAGIFHRLTGVLSSKRLQILSAEIHTLADGLVLDRFYVQDLDFAPPPPSDRIAEVTDALVQSLADPSETPPRFRSVWGAAKDEPVEHLPTQVRLDNSTSERYTIVTVFAYDRLGLLYSISHALYKLGLSVRVAKVSTYLDQIVDVFYVTDGLGRRIEDESRLQEIRTQLEVAIEEKLQTTTEMS